VTIGRFSAGVAALVWCPTDGKYLLLQRSESKDFGGGAWECVTGRVDQGDFYRGPATPENELVGVQFCCSLVDPALIRISAEHSVYRWVTAAEAEGLLPAGHWLRRAIRRAEAIRALSPSALLTFYAVEGLEV
jgi:8-oxo-dGTP diphosphatase